MDQGLVNWLILRAVCYAVVCCMMLQYFVNPFYTTLILNSATSGSEK